MTHIVLLGDSVFDNASYVSGGPDVVRQLRGRLPSGWSATLAAVDGAVTASVARQLDRVPRDATHLIVSVGGNDALGQAGVLEDSANSIGLALHRLADVADRFERDYTAMLEAVLRRGLPTAICTIYDPRFPDARFRRVAITALKVFNDAIARAAFTRGLPLLDLRLICDEDADYANPIEPSVHGGEKIAAAILRAVSEHDFSKRRTEVFARPA
jgi:lysophospholipase L1-like esterase